MPNETSISIVKLAYGLQAFNLTCKNFSSLVISSSSNLTWIVYVIGHLKKEQLNVNRLLRSKGLQVTELTLDNYASVSTARTILFFNARPVTNSCFTCCQFPDDILAFVTPMLYSAARVVGQHFICFNIICYLLIAETIRDWQSNSHDQCGQLQLSTLSISEKQRSFNHQSFHIRLPLKTENILQQGANWLLLKGLKTGLCGFVGKAPNQRTPADLTYSSRIGVCGHRTAGRKRLWRNREQSTIFNSV